MHHLEHLSLLTAGELFDELEGFLDLADGPSRCFGRSFRADDEIVDLDSEGLCVGGEEVGPWRFVAPFPEGDVCVGDLEEVGQLGLGEPCRLAKLEKSSPLCRSRSF